MSDLESARREAIRFLCQAQANDRLSIEAFENRLDQIKQASNQATFAAILADLEDTGAYDTPTVALTRYRANRHELDEPAAPVHPAEYLRLTSVFASTKRAGSWTVPLQIDAFVAVGEMTLDLKDAVFATDVVDITVDVTLGSLTLIVPAGTQIENEVAERFSGSTHSTRLAKGARPNGLLLRIRGKAFMASIDVKERFPSGQAKPGIFDRLLGSGD